LHRALCGIVSTASEEEKLALIRAHPDLVGRAVLTRESQDEQTRAGLLDLSDDEVRIFQRYNEEYRERFGFPFVICARLNKKEAILRAFPQRLEHSREKEIETALEEIYKIAELRLRDLIP
jgi:OHCU decarboxylase